jgi:hypothetical protein
MRFADVFAMTQEDTRKVKTQTTRQTVEVRADGEGLVSHAGAYLLVELADRLGLTEALSGAMAPTRERRSSHDPGAIDLDLRDNFCTSVRYGATALRHALYWPPHAQDQHLPR